MNTTPKGGIYQAALITEGDALPFRPVAWLDICDGCGSERLLPVGGLLCNECMNANDDGICPHCGHHVDYCDCGGWA